MVKKLSLPVVITIFCVIIFLGLMAAVLTKEKKLVQLGKVEKVKKEEIKRTDYTQVARKTLDWIDQQRNEEGWYILGKTCGQKDCEVVWDDKKVGNKDGLIATWARLNFFEQHQDPKDLEIVKKDIDLFYDKYKDDNLSDSLWLCKITYEMAQSKYIDQGQKDKLKELCMKKEIVDFSDQSLEKLKRNLVENNDFSKGVSFSYYFLMFQNVYSGFGNVSELLFKYKFTSDLSYSKMAKEELIGIANKINNKIDTSNYCILGIGALDFYRFSKSNNDLIYATNVHEKIPKEEQLAFNPFCGFLIKSLYKVTNDNKYLIVMEKNNQALVENYNEHNLNSFFVSPNTYPKRDVFMNGLFVEIIR